VPPSPSVPYTSHGAKAPSPVLASPEPPGLATAVGPDSLPHQLQVWAALPAGTATLRRPTALPATLL